MALSEGGHRLLQLVGPAGSRTLPFACLCALTRVFLHPCRLLLEKSSGPIAGKIRCHTSDAFPSALSADSVFKDSVLYRKEVGPLDPSLCPYNQVGPVLSPGCIMIYTDMRSCLQAWDTSRFGTNLCTPYGSPRPPKKCYFPDSFLLGYQVKPHTSKTHAEFQNSRSPPLKGSFYFHGPRWMKVTYFNFFFFPCTHMPCKRFLCTGPTPSDDRRALLPDCSPRHLVFKSLPGAQVVIVTPPECEPPGGTFGRAWVVAGTSQVVDLGAGSRAILSRPSSSLPPSLPFGLCSFSPWSSRSPAPGRTTFLFPSTFCMFVCFLLPFFSLALKNKKSSLRRLHV